MVTSRSTTRLDNLTEFESFKRDSFDSDFKPKSFGTPDEIESRRVLASDDSSYITGTELFVDGGFAQV